MWYSNLYRRHLLDMHIDDWNPDFLSQFSPEKYVENLEKAHVNYAMIYFQSHAGQCFYPTKSGDIHAGIIDCPDMIRRTVQLCKEKGIAVCGYYSLIFNTREHDKHPEWRLLLSSGESVRMSNSDESADLDFTAVRAGRYGHCCPNAPDYREFVYTQIDEMLEYFDFDAIFFDMPFWPVDACYCKNCQEKYRALHGHEIPIEPKVYTAEYLELVRFKYEQMAEFIQDVVGHVKKRRPDMPVECNFASAIAGRSFSACAEEVAMACDYVGGDLYGNMYNHSFACKLFKAASVNQPFEQMLSRCKPALKMHTLSKTYKELKTAIANTMAHHGATLLIDAIDPIGTIDDRVYDQFGKVYAFQKQYEPWFKGEMIEDVGVYYGVRSRIEDTVNNSRECCRILSKSLIRNHVPFGVTGKFGTLDQYSILFMPVPSCLENQDNERILIYVKNGGTIYISGFGNAELIETLTGNSFIHTTEESSVYISPVDTYERLFGGFNTKYPLPFEGRAPVVTPGKNAEVIASLVLPYTKPSELQFAAIHSDPPGIPTTIPAITVNKYGKGNVIWSAVPIEGVDYPEYGNILLSILDRVRSLDNSFMSDAPGYVEITAFQDDSSILVNLSVLNEEAATVSQMPFTVTVKTNKPPKNVELLPDRQSIAFTYENGHTKFKTRVLDIFDMYQIIL